MRKAFSSFNFGQPNANALRGSVARNITFNPMQQEPETVSPFARPFQNVDMSQADIDEVAKVEAKRNRLKMNEPDFSAIEAFKAYLQDAPRREDYNPSIMGRIGAAVSGFGVGLKDPAAGMAVTQSMMEQPYRRAMEEYGAKGQRLGALAEIEASSNKSQVEAYKAMMEAEDKALGREIDTRRITNEEAKTILEKERFGYEKQRDTIEDKQQRAELEARGWTPHFRADGSEFLFNPITGETKNLGPSAKSTEMKVAQQNANAATTRASADVTSANAQQRQAGVAERREDREAQTAMEVTIPTGRARVKEIEERTKNMGTVKSQDALAAGAEAASELITRNPQWAEFYDPNTGSVRDTSKTGFFTDEAELEKFSKEFLKKKYQLLKRQYPTLEIPNFDLPDVNEPTELDFSKIPSGGKGGR